MEWSESTKETAVPHRRAWKWLLVVASLMQLFRIVQVQSETGEVPFLSANDRSRWCTIAALTVNGTYEIDDVIQIRDPDTNRRTWYTIDLVQHRGRDGKQHFYSSKPPLLPTMYAGVYFLVRELTGYTLTQDTFVAARIVLVLVNLLPLIGFWWLLIHWTNQTRLDHWQATVLTCFVLFGTFLSTFANTLNNHLPAAIAVGISLWCLHRVAICDDQRWRWFVLCGLATSFGAANELPALSWVAAAAGVLVVVNWKKMLTAYLPSLLPVAIAFFVLNFWAHGVWKPAYGHRGLGEKIVSLSMSVPAESNEFDIAQIVDELANRGYEISADSIVRPARHAGVWELWDASSQMRFGLRSAAGGQGVDVFQWDDWYDYPTSYWVADRKQGVDRGEPSRGRYVFHCLIGHHGIFSLTPFWLISALGIAVLWQRRSSANMLVDRQLLLGAAVLATSIVTVSFYLARPLEDRNYGGVTSGFRWTFWLMPLWYWLAMHGISMVRSKVGRLVVLFLLIGSVFSANIPWSNPWTSPWLMGLLD